MEFELGGDGAEVGFCGGGVVADVGDLRELGDVGDDGEERMGCAEERVGGKGSDRGEGEVELLIQESGFGE